MSETIANNGYYDFRQSEDGRHYWVDTRAGGTVAEADVLQELAQTPRAEFDGQLRQPESHPAIYHSALDLPTHIVGIVGRHNDEDFLLTDSGEAVPRSRLEWVEEDALPQSPQDRIAELESRNSTLEQRFSELEARFTALEQQQTREVGGFRLNDRVALRNEDPEADEQFSRGYHVTALPEEGAEDLIDIKNDTTNDEQQVPPERLVHENDIPADTDQNVIENEGIRQRLNRAAGWVGGLVSRRQVELHNGAYNFVNRDGTRRTIIQETVVDGYPESQRNNGVVVLALGALAIAATAAAIYAFHKLGDHNSTQEAIRKNAEATQKFRDQIAQLKHTVHTEHNTINKLGDTIASLKDTVATKNHKIADLKDKIQALRLDEAKEHVKQAHDAAGVGKAAGGEVVPAGANQIYVNPGHGYTQEIRDSFPGHSGTDYFDAYKAGIHKFGKDFIEGISKYRMSDGNWGLSRPGAAHWAPRVHKFLESYFAGRG